MLAAFVVRLRVEPSRRGFRHASVGPFSSACQRAAELVSPGNKDRPETRQAFAAKCVSYLTRGIGLIVVDIVTNRLANLHNDVMKLLGGAEPVLLPSSAATYAVAYRPSRQASGDQIE